MPWGKLDDQWYDHPKVVKVGTLGAGLFAMALSWASGKLTDGFLPQAMILRLCPDVENPQGLADSLVTVGLFERVDGGYQIHDYLDYNPSAARVKEIREARAKAGQVGGQRSKPSRVPQASEKQTGSKTEVNEKRKGTPSPIPSPIPNPQPKEEIAAATPPPKPPKRPVKRKRKTDPRTNHPAIQAVREVTNRYPPKPIWDDIIKTLGDEPRVEEMRLCFKEWVKPGFKPTNFAWLFDWYVSGIPPRRATSSSVQEKTADVIKRYRERHDGNT